MLGSPEVSALEAGSVLFVLFLLFITSFKLQILDTPGNISSLGIGLVIGLYGGLSWLLVLLFFMILGVIGTKYKYAAKEARGVAEKRGGKRGWYNVVANGGVPAIIAFVSSELGEMGGVMFVTSLAVASADTLASEIGVLSDRVYLITNPKKKIEPGVDGGVSFLGQEAAFGGALFVSLLAIILMPWTDPDFDLTAVNFFLPLVFGFLGCQIDSLLGATLERRGYLGKGGVNFVSIALGSILGGLVFWAWF